MADNSNSALSAIIAPGNGCKKPEQAHWYSWVAEQLRQAKVPETDDPLFPEGITLRQFPGWKIGSEKEWIPFMEKLGVGPSHVIIGHSTGAIAAMRYAETHRVLGLVLVSAYHTDMDKHYEKLAGYFDRPWLWSSISQNTKWIIQFASPSDSFVPIAEQRYVAEHLASHYIELPDRGHFNTENTFPELVEQVIEHLKVMETD